MPLDALALALAAAFLHAFWNLLIARAKDPEAAKQVNGYRYTPSQQLFLGYAQSWCSKYRDPYARQMAMVDPHSPPHWRVNGPLGNLKEFQQAFQCQEGTKMVRPAAQRCEVW